MTQEELQARIGLLRLLRALGLENVTGISKLIADLIIDSMAVNYDQAD